MEQQNKESIQNAVNTANPLAQPVKQNNTLVIILSVLLLISISISSYFAYQTQTLVKELTTFKNTTEPTPIVTTDPFATGSTTVTSTENWKTYTNAIQNVSFMYPPAWNLTEIENGDDVNGRIYNSSILLKKGTSEIRVIFDLVGIGGGPINVPYDEVELWGKKYYRQYGSINTSTNTKRIDIAETPTSLGAFKMNEKTYSISLTYKATNEGDKPDEKLFSEFNQILSTFKFTN